MQSIEVERTDFKVMRELNIAGERTTCEYVDRYQLHDINEFVSVYFVLNSTDDFYKGKIIVGFERWDDDHDCLDEQFCLAPNEIYKNQEWLGVYFHVEKIVWDYFKKRYTEKTGLTDYDNLWMESEGDCEELIPAYDEDQYMNRRFETRLVKKAA